MIVTVTPNPSIDRTVTLFTPLTRGEVHRVSSVTTEPGGKGVNVAHVLNLAGLDSLAILPSAAEDPLLPALDSSGVTYRAIAGPVGPVRTNIAITETDGTTTKFNEPGAALDTAGVDALTRAVLDAATTATWVVLSGSLPPGVPDTWYAQVVALLAPLPCRVAVDTSDRPLAALAASLDQAAPDLMKPNAEELASITGVTVEYLESAMAQGDPGPVVRSATQLVKRGAGSVLATLGAAGAVLVDGRGSWLAIPPPIVPQSTVGAGDSSLAGYLRADVLGADAPEKVRTAVAYGCAAAALPGSALPAPNQVYGDAVVVHPVSAQTLHHSANPDTKVSP